jgi:hypothetical protein
MLVYKALQNSNGVAVYFTACAADTSSAYEDALDVLSNSTETYSIVPDSQSSAVIQLVKTHVLAMSAPAEGMWRIGWVSEDVSRTVARYVALANGSNITATVSDTGGGVYTTVTAASALFITNGVTAGDQLRIGYTTDVYGTQSYDTYLIDSVDSETQLTLGSGPSAAIGVAVKCEVWQIRTLNQFATAIAAASTALGTRRMYNIWVDSLYDSGTGELLPPSAMCAALAGLRSASAPHQPLTNVEVTGFDIVKTVAFSSTQLNTVAAGGTWIVVKDLAGNIYTRHQLSTDNTDINTQEQSVTTNLDHVSRDYKNGMSDLYGRGNVSSQMLELIRSRINSLESWIVARPYSDTLGPQLQGLVLDSLAIDPVVRSQVDVYLTPELPYPMNNLNIHFRIT